MSEDQIYDIVHDYVNRKVSEEFFLGAKAENPDVNWDELVREEQMMQMMFQSKAYEELGEKMSDDIDKIEKKNFIKKVSVISLLVLGGLASAYFIITSQQTEEVNTGLQEHDAVQVIAPTTLKNTSAEKQTPTSSKAVIQEENNSVVQVAQLDEPTEHVTTSNANLDTVHKEPNVIDTSSVSLVQNQTNTIPPSEQKKIDDEKKKENTPPVVDANTDEAAQQDEDVPPTPDPIVTRNYIINPDMEDYLEIEAAEGKLSLLIHAMSGELVYQNDFDDYDPIIWEGVDQNGNTLPNGLYIYQMNKEAKTVQFGQITITK